MYKPSLDYMTITIIALVLYHQNIAGSTFDSNYSLANIALAEGEIEHQVYP